MSNHFAEVNYSSYHFGQPYCFRAFAQQAVAHHPTGLSTRIPQPGRGSESSWAHKRALHKSIQLLQRRVRKRSVTRSPRSLNAGRAILPIVTLLLEAPPRLQSRRSPVPCRSDAGCRQGAVVASLSPRARPVTPTQGQVWREGAPARPSQPGTCSRARPCRGPQMLPRPSRWLGLAPSDSRPPHCWLQLGGSPP